MNTRNYFFLILLSGIVSYFIQSQIISETILINHYSQQLSLERIEQLLDFSKSWAWLNYALLPMIYLLKFTFITIWLLSGSILFGYKTSFKQIFHIVILAEFVWLIPSVLSLRDTEKFVISLLQKIKQDVAVLMVTHRLQTALESDMIYLLEKAEIVDAGDSKSLLERDNFLSRNYQELMQQ